MQENQTWAVKVTESDLKHWSACDWLKLQDVLNDDQMEVAASDVVFVLDKSTQTDP